MLKIDSVRNLYNDRKIITGLAKEDFHKRFVGSYFGVLWLFVQPIVTVLIYVCVFQLGFKAQPPSATNVPYVLWLIPGIVPWFYFNEAVNMGTNVLYEYSYLVKKVVFRVNSLPIIKNLSCLLVHMIFWLIMMIVFLIYGCMPSIYWIQTFYYTACLFVLISAITMLTSCINVFFKDTAQIVNIALQFGMWVTPIMWSYTMLKDKAWILQLNPVYYITEGYRDCMINNTWFWEKPQLTIYYWVITLLLLWFGNRCFKKLKPHFADVL